VESSSHYEAIRLWCQKFGPDYVRKLKRRQGCLGDRWYLDDVFIRINGQQQYHWFAADQDGDMIDILVQRHRDQRAAETRRDCSPLADQAGLTPPNIADNERHKSA
jgi:transposase-like protein